MRSRLWGLVILAVVPVLLLAVAGCDDDDDDDDGGDDEDTPAASNGADAELTLYFNDLLAIQTQLNEGIRTVDDQFSFSDPARSRQTLDAAWTAGQAALTSMNELRPPAEAQDAHSNLESAGQAYLSAIDTLRNDLQDIEPGEEFDTYIAENTAPDSDFSQAKAGLQEACTEMATVAEENNVDVDLECPV